MSYSRPVTGYPAPNPNGYPNPNPNPYPYPAPPRRTLTRTLVLVSAIVAIIFLVGLLIFWLVLNPHLPTFHLSSLYLTNFTTSQSQVTGNWDVQFQVYNPSNKMSISFDRLVSKLYYKYEYLSQTNIPPLEQGTKNFTTVDARFSVLGSYLDRRMVEAINGERTRGAVKFNFRLDSLAAFRYGEYKTRRRYLTLYCDDVAVNVTASSGGSGKLVGGPRKCKHY